MTMADPTQLLQQAAQMAAQVAAPVAAQATQAVAVPTAQAAGTAAGKAAAQGATDVWTPGTIAAVGVGGVLLIGLVAYAGYRAMEPRRLNDFY